MRGNRLIRTIAAMASLMALLAPSPARAEEAPAPPPAPTTTQAQGGYAAQFTSLAAAMLQFYAASSGSNVQALLQSNSPQVANILGSPTAAFQIGAVSTSADLQQQLQLSGVAFDFSKAANISDLFAEVNAKSSTIDGKVTLFSASYVDALATMRVPALTMPDLDASALPTAGSQVPVEGLAFGLFVNSSITNLVANHPDVFAQVQTSGLGTPAALAAWKNSMLQAGTTVGSDMSRLPMPCIAEMLQGMASGVGSGSSSACGSCSIAGAYLHNHAATLLDPNANTSLPNANSTDPSQMQPWLQNQLNAANPGLSSQLNQVLAPNSMVSSCSAASSAASSALSTTLPGLFSGLSPSQPGTTSTTTPSEFSGLNPALPAPSFPGGFGSLAPANK